MIGCYIGVAMQERERTNMVEGKDEPELEVDLSRNSWKIKFALYKDHKLRATMIVFMTS